MKHCWDCRHYGFGGKATGACYRERYEDPVVGWSQFYRDPHRERSQGDCGPEGKFYRPTIWGWVKGLFR